MTGNASFDANNLQTYNRGTDTGILLNKIKHTNSPQMVLALLPVANANRSAIPTDPNAVSKIITLGGVIKGSSAIDLDQRIDVFKSYFNGKDKYLDIDYAGTTRRYIATLNSPIDIDVTGALKFAPFTVELICADPYGRDISPLTFLDQANYTSSSLTFTPILGGSAKEQLPILQVTIDALTGTGDYIQLTNNANNQAVLVYGQTLTAGDVLVFDSEKYQVTLNDVEIDFNGSLLTLARGTNSITYSDGFATRTVDITGTYTRRYN